MAMCLTFLCLGLVECAFVNVLMRTERRKHKEKQLKDNPDEEVKESKVR